MLALVLSISNYDFIRRRNTIVTTKNPEPSNTMPPGLVVFADEPDVLATGKLSTENASEGIVETPGLILLFDARDGQPGDVQPTPEFSSQYTGPPELETAFRKVSQLVPLTTGPPVIVAVSSQT